MWVDYALRVAKKLLEEETTEVYDARRGLIEPSTMCMVPGGVEIPDVRFRNEVDAIRAAGGKIWRISRDGAGLQGAAAKHQSEAELDTIPLDLFTQHVSNNSTLEALYAVIDRIMKETS